MKPKPFVVLKNLTVPTAIMASLSDIRDDAAHQKSPKTRAARRMSFTYAQARRQQVAKANNSTALVGQFRSKSNAFLKTTGPDGRRLTPDRACLPRPVSQPRLGPAGPIAGLTPNSHRGRLCRRARFYATTQTPLRFAD